MGTIPGDQWTVFRIPQRRPKARYLGTQEE